MWWIPLVRLAAKGLGALIDWDQKQAAKYRCQICRDNNHSTEEHRHPKLSAARKTELVKCQIALPFLLAALVGIPAYLVRAVWLQTVIEWLILWPIWAWAVAHRIRKEQRKENERAYERQS